MEKEIKKYFISDLHLGHKNILTLCNRRFNSIEEHDNYLIDCINETVTISDHLFVLGDLGFHKEFESLKNALLRIKTRNIHIILGNHDNMADLVKLRQEGVISEVKESKRVQEGNKTIYCCHYPLREWPGFYKGYYHAYGHVHATIPSFERSMDVGVDNIGYHPIEFNALIKLIDNQHNETKISKEDEMINEFFPNLSVHYFVGLCTGNPEIREKIYEVLKRR